MIPFNVPPRVGHEQTYIEQAIISGRLCGGGAYARQCEGWFESRFGAAKALLTPSCTHALEMAAILIGIKPGDEVIMPSYTFVSTANAFVLRGATVVFVDVRDDTQNINERLIESAITDRTKAIVPVHYAGVSCEMDAIMELAARYSLYVVEDAAQGMMSTYKERGLGCLGHLGAYSFHETKNYTSGGEGGLLIINDESLKERAEIIREKGTNRSQFFRGMVDKYSWVDVGSSYLPSELQAAYLWAQLEKAEEINQYRLMLWSRYYDELADLQEKGLVSLPVVPSGCKHNAHMFYMKLPSMSLRDDLIAHLKSFGVQAPFHYVPLHDTLVGKRHGRLHGDDACTVAAGSTLLRLPMWYGLQDDDQSIVIESVRSFF